MYINNMKRTFTLLTIGFIMLMAIGARAQVKSYVGFYGGLSAPQSDFGQSNYNNNKAGFAKKGVVLGIDGAYYFYKNLAIGGTLSFQDQGELTSNDVNILATGYTNSFAADQATVTGSGRYHSINILLGPQYSFTYGKFILDLRASAGIMKFYSTPLTDISLIGVTDQTKDFYQRGASPTVFGYSGNASLRYKLSDNVFLTLRGSYVNSQGPKITTDGRTTDIGRIVTRQPITVLQTTLGLNFAF